MKTTAQTLLHKEVLRLLEIAENSPQDMSDHYHRMARQVNRVRFAITEQSTLEEITNLIEETIHSDIACDICSDLENL